MLGRFCPESIIWKLFLSIVVVLKSFLPGESYQFGMWFSPGWVFFFFLFQRKSFDSRKVFVLTGNYWIVILAWRYTGLYVLYPVYQFCFFFILVRNSFSKFFYESFSFVCFCGVKFCQRKCSSFAYKVCQNGSQSWFAQKVETP